MNVDFAQLEKKLNTLPGKIRDAKKEIPNKNAELEKAKLELNVAKAEAILNSERPNATEKQAFALTVTKEQALAVIEAQRQKDTVEVEADYLGNRFIAVRKIASIEESLLKSQLRGN